jgi:excisionase family DNA binding protein
MRPYLRSPSRSASSEEPAPVELRQTLAALLARETAPAPVTASATHVASSAATSTDDDVIDIKGVVELLHVGRNKLYEMVARNQIPHRRFGRCIRFSRAAIMRWLDPCSLQDAKERQ